MPARPRRLAMVEEVTVIIHYENGPPSERTSEHSYEALHGGQPWRWRFCPLTYADQKPAKARLCNWTLHESAWRRRICVVLGMHKLHLKCTSSSSFSTFLEKKPSLYSVEDNWIAKMMFWAEGAGAVLSCCIGCKRMSLSILLEIIVLRNELIGLRIMHLIVHDLTTLMVFACFRSSRAVCACVFG
jgi:hypothetical protein